jgi:hypothetical protein
MSGNRIIILLCGVHSLGFALFHIAFWRIFDWKNDLDRCSNANRAILQIANLRLIYVFLSVAATCFTFPEDLLTTRLGHLFLGGMSLFWIGRLIEQFIFLRRNRVIIHVLNALFLLGAVLFAIPILTEPR